MEFHIITPRAIVHLFSTEGGRLVGSPADILDVRTVKAAHEIQGTSDQGSAAGDAGPQS